MRKLIVVLALAGALISSQALAQTPNADTIRFVQTVLWKLNYNLKVTGVMDEKTKMFIRTYRLWWELPEGLVDNALLERMRVQEFPDVWGSIAISSDGRFGKAVNKKTRADAEMEAQAECESKTVEKGRCTTASAYDPGWVSASMCRSNKMMVRRAVVWGAITLDEAHDSAMRLMASHGFKDNECREVVRINASGTDIRMVGDRNNKL